MAAFVVIWILFALEFTECLAETCEKINDCSCRKSNGKVINLKQIDRGSTPAFKDIKDKDKTTYVYAWNPCTKFSQGVGCKDVFMCQQSTRDPTETYPCANTVASFTVNTDGTTSLFYKKLIAFDDYPRTVEVILKCDESIMPGNMDGVTEVAHYPGGSYSTTLTSKCACDDGCVKNNNPSSPNASGGLSTGSTLLIVFFVLLIVYVIGGILINKYKRGVESMPEMCPNYTFWAGVPSLIKDGVVFTCGGIKSAFSSVRHSSDAKI